MWGKAAAMAGRYLAKRGTVLMIGAVVSAAVAGAAWYVVDAIEDRGSLQAQLAAKDRVIEGMNQRARSWQEHATAIQELARRFDLYDDELAKAKQDRDALAVAVDSKIEDLRRDLPEVETFLSARAPGALVRVYCDDGTLAPGSTACANLDP